MTPPASHQAREALRASLAENQQQHALTEESRNLLADLLENRMRAAVAEGIAEALTEDAAQKFVRSVLAEAQRLATAKAGEAAVGVVGALVKRAALFLFLGSVVYMVGGWTALASLGKFLFDKG
jgi:hypothetical protein